jgi:hypothetical protein
MKPIREHLLISVFLIALFIQPPRVWADMRGHLDGYAHLYVIFSYQDIIGCEVEVSGDKSPYLLAYNTRTKNVSWRRQIDKRLFDTCVNDKGQLLFIEGNYLHCINVLNGKAIHVIDLRNLQWPPIPKNDDSTSRMLAELKDVIKEPKLPPEDKQYLKDEIKRLEEQLIEERKIAANTPKEIVYPTLALMPTSVLIERRILISSKYNSEFKQDAEDWILLDLDTYTLKRSGEGERIFGKVSPEELILGSPNSNNRLSSLKNNTIKDFKHILDKDRPGWSLRSSIALFEESSSHDNRCLIDFRQQIRDDNNTVKQDWEHYALYDSRTGGFTYLDLDPRKEYYTNLLLQNTNLVRYSRCTSLNAKTNSSSLWIESLDLSGNCISHMTLSGAENHRYFSFCGRTTKGDVIFSDSSNYGGSLAEYPYTATGGVVVVEIPSLRIKAQHRFPQDSADLYIESQANTDQIVHVIGNDRIPKMQSESQPHQFIVRAMDVYSGKELWRFTEDVVIRKLKND